jgi:hypothetical protein
LLFIETLLEVIIHLRARLETLDNNLHGSKICIGELSKLAMAKRENQMLTTCPCRAMERNSRARVLYRSGCG